VANRVPIGRRRAMLAAGRTTHEAGHESGRDDVETSQADALEATSAR
jgi:hypothetical protein